MTTKAQLPEDTIRRIRPLAFSILVGVVVCMGLLLLMSFVVSSRDIPQSMISPMAIFSIAVGSFVSGFLCAKILREKGLLTGAICGAILSAVLLLASFGVSDNSFGLLAVIKIMFILFSSMLGGVLGVNTRTRKRK